MIGVFENLVREGKLDGNLRLLGGWRMFSGRGAFDSAKNYKRQSVTAKREMSQTPKFV